MRDKFRTRLLVLLGCTGMALFYLHARAQTTAASCTDNAHLLVDAVLSYTRDHDEFLPPLNSEREIETALLPYVTSRIVFVCPATHEYYRFNRALSGVSRASISAPGTTALLRDARPHSDHKITIAYMDGYVTHGGVDLTPEADCAIFARNVALAARMYAQDYDTVMPAMQNADIFRQAVLPYIGHDNRMFYCPVTGLAFTPNAMLSGVLLSTITDMGTTEVLRDAQPHPDGKVTIAYLDGVVTQGGIDTAPDTDCVTFVHKLVDAITGYASDHNGIFPLMQNNATLQSMLFPYTNDSRVFRCPATDLPYTLNAALSGVNLATIPDYGTVIIAQDAQAHANGKSTVAYLDGHILQGGVAQPNTNVACDDNLRALTEATSFYITDHDETLPPTRTFRQFWAAIYPYVKSNWKFHCPATRLNYVVNPAVSSVSLATISDPAHTVFIQEARPHPNHSQAFGYVDGHVVRR